ncbi:MFS transporter [Spongiibacter thalassae]|uniref:MFS transporter n=1 Tax=Spongiibacter thalassae TaxID=2721624 RepID=UPI001B2FEAC5
MTQAADKPVIAAPSPLAPLKEPVFRRIWTTSLLANFGQLVLGVAVAWEMTRLTSSASMVALVQTAMMLPLMLVALPAGAIADMFDRRKVAMVGLGIAALFGSILSALAFFQLTSPWILLLFCSLIGSGVALYAPAWQSSIGEQVKPADVPAAIALGTVSYNIARSFGPALGGVLVLAAGVQTAFAFNALAYLPLIVAFFLWRRTQTTSRLPPERITRAMVSGARYAFHSTIIRTVLIRIFIFGVAGATATALAPLMAKDLLQGDASIYGILLGANGVGAVSGAVLINRMRANFSVETAATILAIAGGLCLIVMGVSRSLPLTCIGMFLVGGVSMLTISLFNIAVQISVPRWVTARAISLYTSSLTGGIAVGAWLWGVVANHWTVGNAIIASGLFMLALPLFGLFLRLPREITASTDMVSIANEPEVALPITMRSGPIVIEVEYRIAAENARPFYNAMLDIQNLQLRNGGFDWSLTRDIGDPTLWVERYHCPTWADYLRMRDRLTLADMAAHERVKSYMIEGESRRIRRSLERPFGSVRMNAETPDLLKDPVVYNGP